MVLHFEDAGSELLVYLEEGFEALLAGCLGGVLAGECGDEAWILEDGLKVHGPGVVSVLLYWLRRRGSYDLSFTASGSQPSSILGGAGRGAGWGYGDCVFGI